MSADRDDGKADAVARARRAGKTVLDAYRGKSRYVKALGGENSELE